MEKIDCPKCREFDEETKTKMRELFGRDEIIIMASSLSTFLVMQQKIAGSIDRNDLRRFKHQKEMAVSSITMGKFLVSLEDADRENFLKVFEKQTGAKLAIRSELCPHKNEEKTDV